MWVWSKLHCAGVREDYQGWIQRFWKGVALYVSDYGQLKKKILGFRWSKKAKITLQTISFRKNIFIKIFKFSPFLYTMKACQWNLINFSKFANALIWKEKSTYAAVNEKKKLRKFEIFDNRLFYKVL